MSEGVDVTLRTPSHTPALLGGHPAFSDGLRFVRPATPPVEDVVARLRPSYDDGVLTNGPLVRQFEEQAAMRLGTAHAVAVSSCTSGLMLVLQALELKGRVLVPSFTFSASAHAIVWNGLSPVFAECDPTSFQLDLDDTNRRLGDVSAIMATHVFGAPCPAEQLEVLAAKHHIPVIFDAAHGFGSTRNGRPVGGFGSAEIFSLSPTKVLVAGEGGIVTTNDDALAQAIRLGRDYGNPGDYNTRFAGLNARMSEIHAAIALMSLEDLDDHLATRRALARRYDTVADQLPGVNPQAVAPTDRSTYKDYTVRIDEETFGLDRDQVVAGLRAEGIETRCYFSPPVHRQQTYSHLGGDHLPVTDHTAARVVSLPIYRSLSLDSIERVGDRLLALHHHADEVRAALQ